MGPLELADFIGLDVCLGIMRVLHEGLGHEHLRPPRVLVELVAAGHLGQKTGRGFYTYPRDLTSPRRGGTVDARGRPLERVEVERLGEQGDAAGRRERARASG